MRPVSRSCLAGSGAALRGPRDTGAAVAFPPSAPSPLCASAAVPPAARPISSPSAARTPAKPSRSAKLLASRLATITTSVASGSRVLSTANASRSRRLIRFRSAAPPTFRDTDSPSRGVSPSPRGNTYRTNSRPAWARPLRNTRSKSALRDSRPRPWRGREPAERRITRSGACGPCRGGASASLCPRACSSERGTRASALACAFSADRCVSWLTCPKAGREPVYARPRSLQATSR
jgi:hypothetical protein